MYARAKQAKALCEGRAEKALQEMCRRSAGSAVNGRLSAGELNSEAGSKTYMASKTVRIREDVHKDRNEGVRAGGRPCGNECYSIHSFTGHKFPSKHEFLVYFF